MDFLSLTNPFLPQQVFVHFKRGGGEQNSCQRFIYLASIILSISGYSPLGIWLKHNNTKTIVMDDCHFEDTLMVLFCKRKYHASARGMLCIPVMV